MTNATPQRDWLSLITTIAIIITFVCFFALLLGGCNGSPLRLAPSEAQKQNAYLHTRTTQLAALQAREDEASPAVQALTVAATKQSDAILAYTGLPTTLPPANTVDEVLAANNVKITEQAQQDANQRPTWANIIDAVDEGLGLGADLLLALGLGGTAIGGKKILDVIAAARQRAEAAKQIVLNNELFKAEAKAAGNTQALNLFSAAQSAQTPETKILVTAIKAEAEKPIVVAAAPTAAPAATSP